MKTKIIHLLGVILIVLLCVLNIQSHFEIKKARVDYFKRGIYYGVKSLRVLIEQKEEDITWNKLYVMAIMMEYDSKEKNPLYSPLKAPLDECQGRGMGVTNYYPQYEQKTNSVKDDVTVEYNLTKEPKQLFRRITGNAGRLGGIAGKPHCPVELSLQTVQF